MNKLLSIVVPVYNAERFIASAIQSFLVQKCAWAEMILIDDGSTDNSYEQIKPFISDCVKYFRTQNLGAGHARNYGINNACGKWIGFLDSDDLLFPNMLLKLEETLEDNSQINDIIYCSKLTCPMQLSDRYEVTLAEPLDKIENHIPKLEFCTCLYRRTFLLENNVCFFEYKEQDIESAFRFRAFSRTQNIILRDDVILFVRRNNPTSNMNTWRHSILFRVKGLVYLQLFSEYQKYEPKISDYLYNIYLSCFYRFIKYCCFKNGILSDEKEVIKNAICQLADGLKYKNHVHLRKKLRIFCLFAVFLKRKRFVSLFVRLCKKDKGGKKAATVDLQYDDYSYISKKLSEYSSQIYPG